jgi:integrase/recombinase XerC
MQLTAESAEATVSGRYLRLIADSAILSQNLRRELLVADRRRPATALGLLHPDVPLLQPAEQVFQAMLDGWRNQQLSRNLSFATIARREQLVRRFRDFADAEPWDWAAATVDQFFMELRAVRGASRSTLLGYQTTLRLFLNYITDPGYGWGEECLRRFGTPPVQVCHEWNTATHVQDAMARPRKRPLTRDELQDLFDYADDRVERAQRLGRKGWVSAFRISTMVKTAYAWGLRRNEVRMLELCDFGTNPHASQFGGYGVVYVRHGKAMRGSPPKRRSVLTVPQHAWAVECLQEWIEEIRPATAAAQGDPAPLWPTERQDRVSLDAVTREFTVLRDALGLGSSVDFHSLRRSYVTHLIEDGYDALFVQQQAGHEHASTTTLYTSVSSDYRTRTLRAALDKLAGEVTPGGSA